MPESRQSIEDQNETMRIRNLIMSTLNNDEMTTDDLEEMESYLLERITDMLPVRNPGDEMPPGTYNRRVHEPMNILTDRIDNLVYNSETESESEPETDYDLYSHALAEVRRLLSAGRNGQTSIHHMEALHDTLRDILNRLPVRPEDENELPPGGYNQLADVANIAQERISRFNSQNGGKTKKHRRRKTIRKNKKHISRKRKTTYKRRR